MDAEIEELIERLEAYANDSGTSYLLAEQARALAASMRYEHHVPEPGTRSGFFI